MEKPSKTQAGLNQSLLSECECNVMYIMPFHHDGQYTKL